MKSFSQISTLEVVIYGIIAIIFIATLVIRLYFIVKYIMRRKREKFCPYELQRDDKYLECKRYDCKYTYNDQLKLCNINCKKSLDDAVVKNNTKYPTLGSAWGKQKNVITKTKMACDKTCEKLWGPNANGCPA